MKKFLSVLLSVVMLLSVVIVSANNFLVVKSSAKDVSGYSVGGTFTYGSYPQSKVTDSSTLSALGNISKTWTSFGYYSGTGSEADGNMQPYDFMKYCDIVYNGNKYRAVTFSSYRPYYTGYTTSSSNSYQDENGYYTGNVYYFKFEPLTWRVLDPANGYVMCNSIIDAQPYQNIVYYSGSRYYNSKSCTKYASDWSTSSLRTWLNNDFYNTAFSEREKTQIGTTTLDNSAYQSNSYIGASTNDKIFVISSSDATNSRYGFSSSTSNSSSRALNASNYAQCNGYYKVPSSYAGWWFRTADDSYYVINACDYGNANLNRTVINTSCGVVPAFKFNKPCSVHEYESEVKTQPTCTIDGVREYFCPTCGHTYTEKIDKLGHNFGEWVVTVEPTMEAEGVETRYCSRCSATESRTVPKLPPISLKVQDELTTKYKSKDKITTLIYNPENLDYTITYKSSDTSVVMVDDNGNVYGVQKGNATVTCTITDELGNEISDTCEVTVEYSIFQMLVIIFLFGWIWY